MAVYKNYEISGLLNKTFVGFSNLKNVIFVICLLFFTVQSSFYYFCNVEKKTILETFIF